MTGYRPMTGYLRRRGKVLAAALLASTMLGGLALADTASGPIQVAPVAAQTGFSALVTKVRPAVVNIATEEAPPKAGAQAMQQMPPDFPFPDMFRHLFPDQGNAVRHAQGSGFIVDADGYIVTNNHVVDGAHKITVTLDDGSSHPAKVIGRDAKTDLALLKIDAGKALPYVAFGPSAKAEVGDWVIAVGNPFGLGGTVTAGIISAHGRNINEGPYDDFLQIDAPINPGNSGGPLFNQTGQVIGIDTAIYSPNGGSVGIGFAIPSDLAAQVVAQLRDHGKVERGWLGVQMQPISPTMAKALGLKSGDGVLVNEVVPNSPAAKAKVEQGDVITSFAGQPVKSTRDLALAVAKSHAGDDARLGVLRHGKEMTLSVAIGSRDKEVADASGKGGDGDKLGMELQTLTADARSELGLDANAHGVVVAQVEDGSRADESGVQAGDVIVKVGDAAVNSPRQVASRIHEAERSGKEAIPLLVTRHGTTYYVALQLAQG